MKTLPLTTHEIGSLAKPSWKVKAASGTPLNDKDFQEATYWGDFLGLQAETEQLLKILKKRSGFTSEEKQQILKMASLFALRLQEKSGLDIVWDGEQHRVEMYEYPVRRIQGFAFRGHVRSFDNKYYYKASCVGQPECSEPYHVQEYQQISSSAKKPVKIPVTGAYTLVDWSFDENYIAEVEPGKPWVTKARREARKTFLKDIAKNVIYPNLKALQQSGAQYLQIDEPAATTKRAEIEEFTESMRESIGDLIGKAFFSTHICFSDYPRLFPSILELDGILNEVHLEYANRDSRELGVSKEKRKGYEILEMLKDTSFVVGLGVLDVHTDFVESPELVRDRILHACDVLQDPARIFVSPDCGLRTRTWQVSYDKLHNMVVGRDMAKKALGI